MDTAASSYRNKQELERKKEEFIEILKQKQLEKQNEKLNVIDEENEE